MTVLDFATRVLAAIIGTLPLSMFGLYLLGQVNLLRREAPARCDCDIDPNLMTFDHAGRHGPNARAFPEAERFAQVAQRLREYGPAAAASTEPEPDEYVTVTCHTCQWSAYVPKSRTVETIRAHRVGVHPLAGVQGPWSVIA